jgi:FimV-like protein
MNNIVPADEDCLSQDQLSRYVQEDCNLEEMRWIDRHLLNCPMCSDAVEGVMLSDLADFQSVMSRVEAKIEDKVKTSWAPKIDTPSMAVVSPKRFTIGQRGLKWAAAAGLTGIMALGVWEYSTQNRSISKSEAKMAVLAESPAAPTEADMAAAPAAPAAMPQVAAPTGMSKSAPPAAANQPKNAPLPATTLPNVYADAPSKQPETSVPVQPETAQKTDVAIVSPNKNKEESPILDNSTKKPASDAINEVKISETKAEAKAEIARTKDADMAKLPTSPAPSVASAPPSVYEREDGYAGAANQRVQGAASPAKKSKIRKNNNASVLYQNAYNAYNQKSYELAIAGFNQVLAQQPLDKNEIYENTLWYLSDAYLQMGDKVKAKALLERIVAEKLQNQQKAAQKLKHLN